MKTYRQGDVVITPAVVPEGVVKEKTEVIAYGEVTGHAHRTHGNGAIFEHRRHKPAVPEGPRLIGTVGQIGLS